MSLQLGVRIPVLVQAVKSVSVVSVGAQVLRAPPRGQTALFALTAPVGTDPGDRSPTDSQCLHF